MHTHLRALLVAMALPAAAHAQTAGGAVALRYRYVAGQTARYATRTTQTMPGASPTVTTARHEVETVRVNPDGSAQQRLRVTEMNLAGEQLPAAMRTQVASAMRGLTLQYTQDARGLVSARSAVGTVPAEVRPMLDALIESLDQMGAQLPAAPVRPGGSWHVARPLHVVPGALDMSVDVTYTLRAMQGAGESQTATVGVSMTLSTPSGASLRGVRINGSGTATGDAVLELGRGRMGRSHSAGSMRLQMNLGGRNVDLQSTFEHDLRPEAAGPARPTPAARTRR